LSDAWELESGGHTALTPTTARAYAAQAWEMLNNIEDPLVMKLTDSTNRLLDISLRFVLMVFTFAGTMYDLEVLGDMEWFSDEYVYNGDTPLSFFQVRGTERERERERECVCV